MLAALASGLANTDEFISSPLQKHLLREMRIWDAAANGGEVQWSVTTKRWTFPTDSSSKEPVEKRRKQNVSQVREQPMEVDEEFEDEDLEEVGEAGEDNENNSDENLSKRSDVTVRKPTKQSAMLPLIYGQMCTAVKSYQSALCA